MGVGGRKIWWVCLRKTYSIHQGSPGALPTPLPPLLLAEPNTKAAGVLIHRSPKGRSWVQLLFITDQTQSWHMNRVLPSPN